MKIISIFSSLRYLVTIQMRKHNALAEKGYYMSEIIAVIIQNRIVSKSD
ncbi:putative membrane protein YiaA [Neobacillus ginsengisoli]|uniref:Membrane protein YiaA n=1 Tax=Neobacillus ginsengisoli TaxID=904295 RepID=A0ABT9XWJ5_9BACI|nr:putative membrane protein YiaA [Neobacillus ginsengisoli]